MFNTFWAYLYYMFLAGCCGYAILRGSRSEYWGAGIMIVGSLATLAVGKWLENTWTSVEAGIFSIDLFALAALVLLVIKTDRFWPIWATAFHLLAVTVHSVMLVAPQITPWAFATGTAFWAYPMLLALAIGAREHKPLAKQPVLDSG